MKINRILVIAAGLAAGCAYPTVTQPTPVADPAAVCLANRAANTGLLKRQGDTMVGILDVPKSAAGSTYFVTSYGIPGSSYYPQEKAAEIPLVVRAGWNQVSIALPLDRYARGQVDVACMPGPDSLDASFYDSPAFVDGQAWVR